ncbi:MAG: dCTP deaminase, partial [Gammaproteobacteria bacterium]|nr:dCTP deaminase [Gammaproteobacteria bacterium]
MRLSDHDIKKAILSQDILITPNVPLEDVQGVAIDLQLGQQFRVFSGHRIPFIDLAAPTSELSASLDQLMSAPIEVPYGERLIIHPGELILGVTLQSISLSRSYIAWLDGRSSLARLGLMVHATSHRIDPGWNGQIVLEFFNCGRVP